MSHPNMLSGSHQSPPQLLDTSFPVADSWSEYATPVSDMDGTPTFNQAVLSTPADYLVHHSNSSCEPVSPPFHDPPSSVNLESEIPSESPWGIPGQFAQQRSRHQFSLGRRYDPYTPLPRHMHSSEPASSVTLSVDGRSSNEIIAMPSDTHFVPFSQERSTEDWGAQNHQSARRGETIINGTSIVPVGDARAAINTNPRAKALLHEQHSRHGAQDTRNQRNLTALIGHKMFSESSKVPSSGYRLSELNVFFLNVNIEQTTKVIDALLADAQRRFPIIPIPDFLSRVRVLLIRALLAKPKEDQAEHSDDTPTPSPKKRNFKKTLREKYFYDDIISSLDILLLRFKLATQESLSRSESDFAARLEPLLWGFRAIGGHLSPTYCDAVEATLSNLEYQDVPTTTFAVGCLLQSPQSMHGSSSSPSPIDLLSDDRHL